jgi:hypothetical protein
MTPKNFRIRTNVIAHSYWNWYFWINERKNITVSVLTVSKNYITGVMSGENKEQCWRGQKEIKSDNNYLNGFIKALSSNQVFTNSELPYIRAILI